MKVEVEIPEGDYCKNCPLYVAVEDADWCNLLGESLDFSFKHQQNLKHSDCPSLKGEAND